MFNFYKERAKEKQGKIRAWEEERERNKDTKELQKKNKELQNGKGKILRKKKKRGTHCS